MNFLLSWKKGVVIKKQIVPVVTFLNDTMLLENIVFLDSKLSCDFFIYRNWANNG